MQSEGLPAFTPEATNAIMAEWPEPQNPERVQRLSNWRDRRLAALKAHKRRQTRKPN
jgi:hypothetical protein